MVYVQPGLILNFFKAHAIGFKKFCICTHKGFIRCNNDTGIGQGIKNPVLPHCFGMFFLLQRIHGIVNPFNNEWTAFCAEFSGRTI